MTWAPDASPGARHRDARSTHDRRAAGGAGRTQRSRASRYHLRLAGRGDRRRAEPDVRPPRRRRISPGKRRSSPRSASASPKRLGEVASRACPDGRAPGRRATPYRKRRRRAAGWTGVTVRTVPVPAVTETSLGCPPRPPGTRLSTSPVSPSSSRAKRSLSGTTERVRPTWGGRGTPEPGRGAAKRNRDARLHLAGAVHNAGA